MIFLLENGKRVELIERLTFDRLFRISDPKRVFRSGTVSGPPMEIDAYADSVYYTFNFKSNPSTTGLRHKGYVKFFKPRSGSQKPLQHVPCLVDCTCPDYRYRWAWANKQRGSSRVGTNSLNQALNRAPRITNPSAKPGLCKHILATREYLYGLLTTFAGDEPDTAEKLNKLVKYAQKRWKEFPDQMAAAKARERRMAAAKAARRAGAPLPALIEPEPAVELTQVTAEPVVPEEAVPSPLPEPSEPPAALTGAAPLAVPPGQRQRGFAAAEPNNLGVPPSRRGRRFPGGNQNQNLESVDSMKDQPMKAMPDLKEQKNIIQLPTARKLVEEMIDDVEVESDEQALVPVDDTMPAPSEGAIGADTEGAAVLDLLSEIRDLLTQLAAPEAEGEDEVAIEGGDLEAEGEEGDEEYDADFPPPPSGEDLDGEDDEEEEEHVPAAA